MTDRRAGPNAPTIRSGKDYGKPRARRRNAPAPGGRARWRKNRSDKGAGR
jgi:hypothetical protein